MACIARPDAEVQRPVDRTRASGRPDFLPSEGVTALFVRGVINMSCGRPLAMRLDKLSTLEPWWLV